jgi:hypothetical protein
MRDFPAVRTPREQQVSLESVGVVARPTLRNTLRFSDPSAEPVLARVEQAIRMANENEESLRRPVSWEGLRRLRTDLSRACGRNLSPAQVQALTDCAHALLREAPNKSLAGKLAQGVGKERPGLHGQVAELAEARERRMVLTRNKQSRVFDLTEDRLRPRSAQLKVYQDDLRAVREVLADLRGAPRQARHGIVTQAALDRAEAVGLVRKVTSRGTPFYKATDGSKAVLMPSKAFGTPQESRRYTALGREALEALAAERPSPLTRAAGVMGTTSRVGMSAWLLVQSLPETYQDIRLLLDPQTRARDVYLRLGQHGTQMIAGGLPLIEGGMAVAARLSQQVAQSSRLMAISRWAGPVGCVALAGTELFMVWEWGAGYRTDRQFYTGQAHFWGGLAGGMAGGWAGAKAGAAVGGGIGAFFGPEGIPVGAGIGAVVGALGGGVAGGYAGSQAFGSGASMYFEIKDRQQEAKRVEFIYAHYGADR